MLLTSLLPVLDESLMSQVMESISGEDEELGVGGPASTTTTAGGGILMSGAAAPNNGLLYSVCEALEFLN